MNRINRLITPVKKGIVIIIMFIIMLINVIKKGIIIVIVLVFITVITELPFLFTLLYFPFP